ncbi:hypothetical protein BH10BAC5_BH10BAC5_06200 [soil metagenome]
MKKNLSRIILTIFLVALAIYFIYPTYQDYSLNQELKKLSGQDSADFVEKNSEKLRSVRDKRLKLGLDLKGGMYVVIDVDVIKLIEDLAKKKDDQFNTIITELRNDYNIKSITDEQIMDSFKKKLAAKNLTLKSYYGEIRDDESSVEKKLLTEIEGSLDRAVEIVRNRIDQYGVAEPQIQKIGGNRIIVELPGVSNQEEVRKLLQGTALLEFKIVKDPEQAFKVMQSINTFLAGSSDSTKKDSTNQKISTDIKDSTKTSLTSASNKDKKDSTKNKKDLASNKTEVKKDTTKNKKDTTKTKKDSSSKLADTNVQAEDTTKQLSEEEFKQKNPFFYLVRLNQESGTADGYVRDQDKEKVDKILAREDVKNLIPSDIQFAWSNKTFQSGPDKIHVLYVIKKDPELTGKVITNARSNIDPSNNQPIVTMEMNSEGAADWGRITGANIKKRMAIVLDNVVYSAPVINTKITGGNSQIEGMGSIQEAKLLEIVLKAGALPAPVKIIEERSIGPSLGEDSIRAGVYSSVAALLLVALFMVVYYKVGGSVADVALIINVLFVVGIMASLKATLTVPGIAGLILTLGMAVDTNVLIFERIREELATGKPLRTSIEVGYKKAFSAIFDTHVTSIITGIILYQFGTGPIQGFALTLLFGLVANLFTAIVITHFIFDIMVEKGKKVSFG